MRVDKLHIDAMVWSIPFLDLPGSHCERFGYKVLNVLPEGRPGRHWKTCHSFTSWSRTMATSQSTGQTGWLMTQNTSLANTNLNGVGFWNGSFPYFNSQLLMTLVNLRRILLPSTMILLPENTGFEWAEIGCSQQQVDTYNSMEIKWNWRAIFHRMKNHSFEVCQW